MRQNAPRDVHRKLMKSAFSAEMINRTGIFDAPIVLRINT
jgi:hypothetical protein